MPGRRRRAHRSPDNRTIWNEGEGSAHPTHPASCARARARARESPAAATRRVASASCTSAKPRSLSARSPRSSTTACPAARSGGMESTATHPPRSPACAAAGDRAPSPPARHGQFTRTPAPRTRATDPMTPSSLWPLSCFIGRDRLHSAVIVSGDPATHLGLPCRVDPAAAGQRQPLIRRPLHRHGSSPHLVTRPPL